MCYLHTKFSKLSITLIVIDAIVKINELLKKLKIKFKNF